LKTDSGHRPLTPPADPGTPASPLGSAPSGFRLWWRAVRPRTLVIAVSPVLAGSALALAELKSVDLAVVAAALLGALAIQAGTNLYNDVADFLKGGDQPIRQGPARVTAMGWASPAEVKRAALVAFFIASLCGLYLVYAGGWPILLLGLLSLVAGWAYSLGPWPIAYTPLGELFVIAFFGLGAVGGSYYLQAHHLGRPVLALGLALGFIAAGVLMANNYRDIEPDRLAGRRTLAILVGPEMSKILYGLFLALPFALAFPPLGPSGGWLALLLLPAAFRLVHSFALESRGPAFNRILGGTAIFQLEFALLVALGAFL
jgi:1,4-dihydroxy-2-naphthoate octaprenyltransferase